MNTLLKVFVRLKFRHLYQLYKIRERVFIIDLEKKWNSLELFRV